MKPWFEVGDDNSGWSAQKVTNLHLMLQVHTDEAVHLYNGLLYGIILAFIVSVLCRSYTFKTGVNNLFPVEGRKVAETHPLENNPQ